MKREILIKRAVALVEKIAKDNNMKINNQGLGTDGKDTAWAGLFPDNSQIPRIVCENEELDLYLELRPVFGALEIDWRNNHESLSELLVLQYSCSEKTLVGDKWEFVKTDDFKLSEVRATSLGGIEIIEHWIEFINNPF